MWFTFRYSYSIEVDVATIGVSHGSHNIWVLLLIWMDGHLLSFYSVVNLHKTGSFSNFVIVAVWRYSRDWEFIWGYSCTNFLVSFFWHTGKCYWSIVHGFHNCLALSLPGTLTFVCFSLLRFPSGKGVGVQHWWFFLGIFYPGSSSTLSHEQWLT